MARPVAVLPVKLTTFTCVDETSSFAPSEPASEKMLTTPFGISFTEAMISLISWAVCAATWGILMAAVQPAASAGARERIDR